MEYSAKKIRARHDTGVFHDLQVDFLTGPEVDRLETKIKLQHVWENVFDEKCALSIVLSKSAQVNNASIMKPFPYSSVWIPPSTVNIFNFGQISLSEVLGRGSFAEVNKAQVRPASDSESESERLAFKKWFHTDEALFRKEVKLLSSVSNFSHPNVLGFRG